MMHQHAVTNLRGGEISDPEAGDAADPEGAKENAWKTA